MTDKEYVIRAAHMKKLSLIKPEKGQRIILAHDFNKKDAHGVYPCVIDATTWAEARAQINKFYQD